MNLPKDIENTILHIIEKDLLLVSFYGKRKQYLMKDVIKDTGEVYTDGYFCEQILVIDHKDISLYIHSRLRQYIDTGKHNIFSSLYQSNYNNKYQRNEIDSCINLLNYELKNNNYNWLNVFSCLNLKNWDKGTVFNIDIKPFNKLKIF